VRTAERRIKGHVVPVITFACGCDSWGNHGGQCETAKDLERRLFIAADQDSPDLERVGKTYNRHFSRTRNHWPDHGKERVRWQFPIGDLTERYCAKCKRWTPVVRSGKCCMCGTLWIAKGLKT
jgi:hypothetical protein